ncbi:MAG: DNA topoisomerase IV subunit B, partial [Clostridiales bacterium]|nr:DNA topoisomerase IV subunit B [Clostridiales bacterium]
NQTKSFQYEGGIADYVGFLNTDKTALHDGVILLEGSRDDIVMQAAIQFTDSYTENLFSYVNNIPTGEGGSHEVGFRSALTKAFNDYARKIGALKEKDNNLAGEDYREGMTAILAVKVPNPQFEGQTKGRLGNTEVRPVVEALALQRLSEYLEDLRNAAVAQKIIEKSIKSAKVREAARKARDVARTKSELEAAPLVGKLSSCTGRNPRENELFIVEGDSAGGSAKQGRDRRFQAILPLRGKPLNVEKKRIDQVLANEEFRSIITALGTNIDRDFNLKSLKYDKVIILSDADQDGAHIRAILLTFFFRYMRDLISAGHVYIGMPPLYLIKTGNKELYAYDDKELNSLLPKGKNYTLQRYKGLGEMNPEQLWHTTMDPAQRKLTQVTIEDGAESDRLITILMGDKVEPRREYISENANFNKPDNFIDQQR